MGIYLKDINHGIKQSTLEIRNAAASQFELLREPISQLTKSLLRALEGPLDQKDQKLSDALNAFHQSVPVPLALEYNRLMSRPDFLAAISPAQILYHSGLHEAALTYIEKLGPPVGIFGRMVQPNLHKCAAEILNYWYISYHEQMIWDLANDDIDQFGWIAQGGITDPLLKVIDGVLTGKPEHSAYSKLDKLQRADLREWKAKLVPKAVGDEKSARLRNNSSEEFEEFFSTLLEDPEED